MHPYPNPERRPGLRRDKATASYTSSNDTGFPPLIILPIKDIPPLNAPTVLPRIQTKTGVLLGRSAAWLERRPSILLVIFLAIYLPATLSASHHKPLWHDELFTYYLAQAPTLGQMWSDLRTHDLNPPLVYVLTRISFRIFGVSTMATRLPEIAFFLLIALGIYRFVRHRMGVLYGAFAVALLLLGKTSDLALEARPYTLFLGFLAIALAAWQQATDATGRRRKLAIAVLAACIAGMLLSHIFAIPALGALLFAEAWRARHRGKLDWPILAALLLPCSVIALYAPMLRNHGSAIYPEFFQPTGQTIFDFYIGSIERELICLLLTALTLLIFLGPRHLRGGSGWSFQPREWAAIIALITLPLLLMLQLMLSHGAFFPRYGAAAGLGVVCLTTALLGRWTATTGRLDPRAALVGIVIALAISDHTAQGLTALFSGEVFHTASEPVLPVCQSCQRTAATGLPLVDASGIAFLEMNHNESPTTLDRLFYLTDTQASTQIAHANIFEQMPQLVDRFHLRGHSLNYHAFLADHKHFYVLGRFNWPEDWLLAKLLADGANVRLVQASQDQYRDTELYEVTIPQGRQ